MRHSRTEMLARCIMEMAGEHVPRRLAEFRILAVLNREY